MVEPSSRWRFTATSRPSNAEPLVLVVDPEARLEQSIGAELAGRGFRTVRASTRAVELSRAIRFEPDLVLLDLRYPSAEGVGLTAWIRGLTPAPIVAVLLRSREGDQVPILDAGANDYILYPFERGELLGRLRVWLRQTARAQPTRMPSEPPGQRLRIDRDRRVVLVDGREVHITPLECKLLLLLAHSQSRGATEEQMLEAVWGPGARNGARHLRAGVRQLRQKIERDPARPRYLVTEGGRYRLKLS
jgi:two-component system KDP operon response regulator KdpE